MSLTTVSNVFSTFPWMPVYIFMEIHTTHCEETIQYMKLSGRNRHVCNVVDIDMMYVIVGLKLILDQFNVRLVICLKKK